MSSRLITETIELLGRRARDRVTGFEGIIDSVGFDLYGCVQATVRPPLDKDEKLRDACWFDVQRLELLPDPRVMPIPNSFSAEIAPESYERGPALKPAQRSA